MNLAVDAALFDMDGVLVDSSAAVERHWKAFALRNHLDFSSLHSKIHGRRSSEVIEEFIPNSTIDSELAWMEALELAEASDLSVLPGATALTERLEPESWAIVTSGSRSIALARLASANITVPRILITSEDVTEGKPDPAGYLLAAESLRVNLRKCVVFEDAPAGVAAARAANMLAVALSTTHAEAELASADHLIANLSRVDIQSQSPLILTFIDL